MAPTLTRRQTLTAALAAGLIPLVPQMATAQSTPAVTEMTLGNPDAPVTLVEYAMFTCPHCADFTRDVFPKIKEKYIDTGKVKLVFREVYYNKPALWAGMIARCAPADRYFGITEVMFATQAKWIGTGDDAKAMLAGLYSIGRQAGLTDAQMDACMNDRATAEALVAEFQKTTSADGIEGTPTFILNGERIGNLTWEEFDAKLQAAVGS